MLTLRSPWTLNPTPARMPAMIDALPPVVTVPVPKIPIVTYGPARPQIESSKRGPIEPVRLSCAPVGFTGVVDQLNVWMGEILPFRSWMPRPRFACWLIPNPELLTAVPFQDSTMSQSGWTTTGTGPTWMSKGAESGIWGVAPDHLQLSPVSELRASVVDSLSSTSNFAELRENRPHWAERRTLGCIWKLRWTLRPYASPQGVP